jgi:hypothetical protein
MIAGSGGDPMRAKADDKGSIQANAPQTGEAEEVGQRAGARGVAAQADRSTRSSAPGDNREYLNPLDSLGTARTTTGRTAG